MFFLRADQSPVLLRMLEYSENRIELEGLGPKVGRQLLQFMYRNQSDCFMNGGDLDSLIQLFLAADYFMIDELKLQCEEMMVSGIRGTHVIDLWEIADYFGLRKLLDALRRFCWK